MGRLKLKLFEEMTGKKYYIPDNRQYKSFVLKHTQSNTYFAQCLTTLLNVKSIYNIKYSDLDESFNLSNILQEIEIFPLENALFLEIIECSEDLPNNLGVLVECRTINENPSNGYLYTLILISEMHFPEGLFGVFEIRASANNPEPMLSTLSSHGWNAFDVKNYHNANLSILATQILNFVSKVTSPKLVNKKNIRSSNLSSSTPLDQNFLKFLNSARQGIINCSVVEIPLSLIRPYDMDFCLSYPLEIIKIIQKGYDEKKYIQPNAKNCLLVYWDNDHFVTSDDYASYLSYRSLKIEIVPCVILGSYPTDIGKTIRVGGAELIPSITVFPSKKSEVSEFEMQKQKEKILNERLDLIIVKDPKLDLYTLFKGLCELIQNPSTKERQLHEFILKHPICLDTYNFNILSEFRFGNDYRADLVLQYKFNDKRIVFVELEKASLPIFTKAKSKRETYHVNHAIQQVADWLRWCRENPNQIPQPLDSSLPIEGLVVIGRSFNMSENERKILVHNNQNRLVKVITYDDLLSRIEALIHNLENNF